MRSVIPISVAFALLAVVGANAEEPPKGGAPKLPHQGIAGPWAASQISVDVASKRLRLTSRDGRGPATKIVVYTTMATWCTTCKTELTQWRQLRSVFEADALEMFAVPYDERERADTLRAWVAAHRPPYVLLTSATADQIAAVKKMVVQALRFDGVPAAIVTGRDGRVLLTRWGAPSVSELRELLWVTRDGTVR